MPPFLSRSESITGFASPSASSSPPSPASSAETKLPSPHSASQHAPSMSSLPFPAPASPSASPSLPLRRRDAGTGRVGHSCPVIIFDWDDTLLASSFLSSQGCRLDSDLSSLPAFCALLPHLQALDCAVHGLLSAALSYSPHDTHIITNAETGWVQMSAAKFLPATFPLLARVRVMSARSTFEPVFPCSPLRWKLCAFQQQLLGWTDGAQAGEENRPLSVISLGDSHVEREAVRAATRSAGGVGVLPDAGAALRCKSVKFSERSDCEQLRRQVELVTSCFAYIAHYSGDLDLQLTVTVNAGEAETAGGSAAAPETEKLREAERQRAAERESQLREEKLQRLCDSEYEGSGDSEMGSERQSEHAAFEPIAQTAA